MATGDKMSLEYLMCAIAEDEVMSVVSDAETTSQEKDSKLFCTECSTPCKFKGELLYHQLQHGIREDLIPCHECKLAFTKMFAYRNHHKCVHEKVKRHKCTMCDKSFFFKKDLPKHVMAVHQKLKPYQCPTCDRAFAKKEHMQRHVKALHSHRADVAIQV
mmetsp:Transcript_26022/g.102268  ORF Transcript_26022/g.102268 Transcript_26022/m.102268 type:complete len:160 (-) Transcript_26022:1109-1588(-)|eukprot:CAMPEP_0113968722 /NCGR_PEP_ID=MMETSP0011_2-20120614/9729_1 /TAXON_ID=101924 /ORGANISM="Rhodosorus marinus" /LENGTH=159 /DNA_ID=CAMNT_0000981919 /DNA_START=29 /DNA_END=508 /DNA_ORIENTATION=+ /assembly_acc=CAM_ASM_000156